MASRSASFVWAVAASLAMVPSHALACTCLWNGPFLTVAGAAPLVVTVRVDGYGAPLAHGDQLYESMHVTVLETLAGESPSSTLVVHGDPGDRCRPYVTPLRFARNGEYVMAIHPIHAADATDAANATDFEISACGEYWLPRRDGAVIGRIRNDNEEHLPYDELRDGVLAERAWHRR